VGEVIGSVSCGQWLIRRQLVVASVVRPPWLAAIVDELGVNLLGA
jgi:hypothetical protein